MKDALKFLKPNTRSIIDSTRTQMLGAQQTALLNSRVTEVAGLSQKHYTR